MKPDLAALRVFGSRVCVKRTGHRRSKLDGHDFTGIFLGYTATDNNITYIDLDSGLVKTSLHAQFDEAWYLQDSCPSAAQLLYDLGLEADDDSPLRTLHQVQLSTLQLFLRMLLKTLGRSHLDVAISISLSDACLFRVPLLLRQLGC